jgi:hypothetical protein
MKKQRKKTTPQNSNSEQDHYLMRVKKGERQIVQNVKERTNTGSDEFEELDLSVFSSIDEQIEFLKRRKRRGLT